MAAAHGDCAVEGRVERGGLLCVAGRRRSLRRAFGSIGRRRRAGRAAEVMDAVGQWCEMWMQRDDSVMERPTRLELRRTEVGWGSSRRTRRLLQTSQDHVWGRHDNASLTGQPQVYVG